MKKLKNLRALSLNEILAKNAVYAMDLVLDMEGDWSDVIDGKLVVDESAFKEWLFASEFADYKLRMRKYAKKIRRFNWKKQGWNYRAAELAQYPNLAARNIRGVIPEWWAEYDENGEDIREQAKKRYGNKMAEIWMARK